jgi:hypothetical protein
VAGHLGLVLRSRPIYAASGPLREVVFRYVIFMAVEHLVGGLRMRAGLLAEGAARGLRG